MFKKVLIANRGEIAVRITQTLQEMGIAAVAVFSEADRASRHVHCADEAYELPGVTAAESYLNAQALIEVAQKHGVDAIHPGYGFLSENAEFARACAESGLTFIGPSPEVIATMGDKIVAKQTLAEAGLPMVPGWAGSADAPMQELERAADEIGYPVLLKAAAGGGGKGMRVVHARSELEAARDAAQREAKSAFGDARIFLEKFLERPRHIEFQIFGDTHGNVVHMFERECSIQRRHQKIIEESPAPALSESSRKKMGAAAVAAARKLNYTNAGTIEFLVDADDNFYFLEVNTRLQVEHPVTELLINQNLVRLQVLVAAGEPLPLRQEDIRRQGHAIEARIYAEDPAGGFLPSTGRIEHYREPRGHCVRVDGGVSAGAEIGVHYDPMLAKLIAWGQNRAEARQRLLWALSHYVVLGVTTNIDFLADVIGHPAFADGDTHTQFIDEHDLLAAARNRSIEPAALIAAAFAVKQGAGGSGLPGAPTNDTVDPWLTRQHWRNT